MDHENLRAAFERYNEEHKGEPIAPDVAEQAKRELLLDALHARQAHEEPTREAIIASMPEGALLTIPFADEKIPEAIAALTTARTVLIDYLSGAASAELSGDPHETTFIALEEALSSEHVGARFSEELTEAVEAIKAYMIVDPKTTLYDLPERIREFLSLLKRKQNSSGNPAANDDGEDGLHGTYGHE
jgi:hypothetical protein